MTQVTSVVIIVLLTCLISKYRTNLNMIQKITKVPLLAHCIVEKTMKKTLVYCLYI